MRIVFNRHVLLAAPSQSCSGFATLGRPVSLPLGKQPHHRSSSDPDLPGSNPGSPDAEVAGLLGTYTPHPTSTSWVATLAHPTGIAGLLGMYHPHLNLYPREATQAHSMQRSLGSLVCTHPHFYFHLLGNNPCYPDAEVAMLLGTLDPACNELGYNEQFWSQERTLLIDINVKNVHLQQVPLITSKYLWIKLFVLSGTQCT